LVVEVRVEVEVQLDGEDTQNISQLLEISSKYIKGGSYGIVI